jgi:ubiquinone/menaquinone biosynthesis C-methylase UbiE
VRFELVTRALLTHLPEQPARIVDIGGGFGRQAVMLARAGHEIVVVDPDERMLTTAADLASREPVEVRRRITFVAAPGSRRAGSSATGSTRPAATVS